MSETPNPYRMLPQVDRLLHSDAAHDLVTRYGKVALTVAIRTALTNARTQIADGQNAPDEQDILKDAARTLFSREMTRLQRVINATGIVIHTNLGRAPLAPEATEAILGIASGYSNLETNLETGRRGSRMAPVEPLLCDLTGAEAALAVNNGAAGVLLAISGLAAGAEVIVSRAELVEIGGGFRIPDVIRQSGARLVEVGTTNRTRLDDYAAAIGPETRVLLKVHQSNFAITGFTADVSVTELAGLAACHNLKTVVDLGSGLVAPSPLISEPTITDTIASGADLVICSGDKLLGGPQAGLLLGTVSAIAPLRRHPLLRAMRLDKLVLTALEATLRLHRDSPHKVPVMAMLQQDEATLKNRAMRLATMAGGGKIVPTTAYAGGGAIPGKEIPSFALAFRLPSPNEAAEQLRTASPPVIARISSGQLILDMLTVQDDELAPLASALGHIIPA